MKPYKIFFIILIALGFFSFESKNEQYAYKKHYTDFYAADSILKEIIHAKEINHALDTLIYISQEKTFNNPVTLANIYLSLGKLYYKKRYIIVPILFLYFLQMSL